MGRPVACKCCLQLLAKLPPHQLPALALLMPGIPSISSLILSKYDPLCVQSCLCTAHSVVQAESFEVAQKSV
eukprot:5486870-Amphidinium_carterae.1